jgi:hypothetical protein
VLAHQRPLEARRPRGRRRVGMAVDQRVERLEQHLAIARSAEPPASVAEGDVLAPVDLVTELITGQPHGRAQALEALARLVHRRARFSRVSPLSRSIDMSSWPRAMRRTPSGTRSPSTRRKPALLLPGTCLHARHKALRSDPRANAKFARTDSTACRAARCSYAPHIAGRRRARRRDATRQREAGLSIAVDTERQPTPQPVPQDARCSSM